MRTMERIVCFVLIWSIAAGPLAGIAGADRSGQTAGPDAGPQNQVMQNGPSPVNEMAMPSEAKDQHSALAQILIRQFTNKKTGVIDYAGLAAFLQKIGGPARAADTIISVLRALMGPAGTDTSKAKQLLNAFTDINTVDAVVNALEKTGKRSPLSDSMRTQLLGLARSSLQTLIIKLINACIQNRNFGLAAALVARLGDVNVAKDALVKVWQLDAGQQEAFNNVAAFSKALGLCKGGLTLLKDAYVSLSMAWPPNMTYQAIAKFQLAIEKGGGEAVLQACTNRRGVVDYQRMFSILTNLNDNVFASMLIEGMCLMPQQTGEFPAVDYAKLKPIMAALASMMPGSGLETATASRIAMSISMFFRSSANLDAAKAAVSNALLAVNSSKVAAGVFQYAMNAATGDVRQNYHALRSICASIAQTLNASSLSMLEGAMAIVSTNPGIPDWTRDMMVSAITYGAGQGVLVGIAASADPGTIDYINLFATLQTLTSPSFGAVILKGACFWTAPGAHFPGLNWTYARTMLAKLNELAPDSALKGAFVDILVADVMRYFQVYKPTPQPWIAGTLDAMNSPEFSAQVFAAVARRPGGVAANLPMVTSIVHELLYPSNAYIIRQSDVTALMNNTMTFIQNSTSMSPELKAQLIGAIQAGMVR